MYCGFLYYLVVIVGASTIAWNIVRFVEWLDSTPSQRKPRKRD